jgi:heat shock protein HslJ
MHWIVPIAGVLALGLSACDEERRSESLNGTEWVAESINGKPVIEPGGVTLLFENDRIAGRSGCNRYFGAASHANGSVKIEQVGATKMACLRDGLMQQESEFLTTLQASQTYAVREDGRLVLTGSGSLVFNSAAPR